SVSTEYRNNHYVPVWYQKRFLEAGDTSNELFYLDLNPGTFTDGRRTVHRRRETKKTGVRRCFAETDLYTTRFGGQDSTELEKVFFGAVDTKGRDAVAYFAGFEHPDANGDHFNHMLTYMCVQKLRTPKGLAWLAQRARTTNRNAVLPLVVRLQ